MSRAAAAAAKKKGSKGFLEAFKFTVYVAVPIALVVFTTKDYVKDLIVSKKPYVVYPPEDPRARRMQKGWEKEKRQKFQDHREHLKGRIRRADGE